VQCIAVEKGDTVEMIESIRSRIDRLDCIMDLQRNLRSQIVTRGLSKLYSAPVFSWKKQSTQRSVEVLKARLFGRSRAASKAVQSCSRFQYQAMLDATRYAMERKFGVQHIQAHPKLTIDLAETSWSKELKFGTWLGIAPGAAHPTKRSPARFLASILRELQAKLPPQQDLHLVFLGDHHDREISISVIDELHWRRGGTLNLCGKLTLSESAHACSKIKALLSHDSSMTHIAEAVCIPVAALFGPTIEAFGFAPHRSESRAFSSLLGCRPCSKHGKSPCRYGDQLCFHSIPRDSIVDYLMSRVQNEE
jgi:ADP-heptose:LPS heptosyltransferase